MSGSTSPVVRKLPVRALDFLDGHQVDIDRQQYKELWVLCEFLDGDALDRAWAHSGGQWSGFLSYSTLELGRRWGPDAQRRANERLDPTTGEMLDLRVSVMARVFEEVTGEPPAGSLRTVLRHRRSSLAHLEAVLRDAALHAGTNEDVWKVWRVALRVEAEFCRYRLADALPVDWVRGVARLLLVEGVDEKVLMAKADTVGRKNGNAYRRSAYDPFAYWYKCCLNAHRGRRGW